jgi:tetratricopeptide (TPR) repeat protein
MLTPEEQAKESKAEAMEGKGNFLQAAGDWLSLAADYLRKAEPPHPECCYLCQAARAYYRAANDLREEAKRTSTADEQANLKKQADEAFEMAAKLFLKCGDVCFEAGDLACATEGFAQAEAYYRLLEKEARAAGKGNVADEHEKRADQAEKSAAQIDKLLHSLQKEQSDQLKQKGLQPLKSVRSVGLELSPRTWLGARLDSNLPRVRGTIAQSPAARARLCAGDIIIQLGGVLVEDAAGLCYLIKGLHPGKACALSVRRGARRIALHITPALNLYSEADRPGEPIDDRRCDRHCTCERPRKNAACSTSYQYKGEGPNGGVMLLIRCVAMTTDFEILDEKECGPFEFF